MREAQGIKYDPKVPPRHFKLPAGAWEASPGCVRSEIIRADAEMRRGIALHKDRICGRGKRDPLGFYGLERAEDELHKLETRGARKRAIEDARATVASLKTSLAKDAELIEVILEFGPFAAAQGKTLVQKLEEYTHIEGLMRNGDMAGMFFEICAMVGADPVPLLMKYGAPATGARA